MVRNGSFLSTHLIPGGSVPSPTKTGGGCLASTMTLRAVIKIMIDPMITTDEGIVKILFLRGLVRRLTGQDT
jgi:hypothetical protein